MLRNLKRSIKNIFHNNSVFALTVLQDGTLARSSEDELIRIWNLNSGLILKTLTDHTS